MTRSPHPSRSCRIGINGFGRIGRNVLRASLLRDDVEVVAINHTCATAEDVAYLIKFDSTHGPLMKYASNSAISALPNGNLSVNGRVIHLMSERDLMKLDWRPYGAEYVAECTGKFRSTATAQAHVVHGGAKRVLISAPSPDAPSMVYRVNSEEYVAHRETSETVVFSCASCTTNCLAPLLKVLDNAFGIEQGLMTTVHASTQSQHVLDGYSAKDRRSGRSAIGNIIPTTTGASKAIRAVLPHLAGKINGISVRVPTTNVSMIDLVVQTKTATTLQDMLGTFRQASEGKLVGVLEVEDQELVSCDFLGRSCSAIIDSAASSELNANFFKIVAWYDNEWSYSCRLLDLLAMMNDTDGA